MSGKHTPGPWEAVSASSAAEVSCMEIAEVAHMRVIPAGGGWPTPGTPEDDARLIAAAPELLEALQAAVSCGMVPITSASEGGAAKHSEMVRVADLIRAAIAKATGDQPKEQS